MAKWTLKKYKKMCEDANSDVSMEFGDDGGEAYYELATSCLEFDPELRKFMKEITGAGDLIGCLCDDMSYPSNCDGYVVKSKSKGKRKAK